MKNMVLLTQKEYNNIVRKIHRLEDTIDMYREELDIYIDDRRESCNRFNSLWDFFNRPAIEALQEKHDQEYYDWCTVIAEKYEKLDEEEWVRSRARFYNNGVYGFCIENNISEEEACAHRQYYDRAKFWSASAVSSGLMAECDNMEMDVLKTEGWSDLPYYHVSDGSWILFEAQEDAWERYQQNKHKTGRRTGKYWNLWSNFVQMEKESECLGNECYEFYR